MVSATWEGMAVPVQLGAFPCERRRRGEVVAACRHLVGLASLRQVAEVALAHCKAFYFQRIYLHDRTGID